MRRGFLAAVLAGTLLAGGCGIPDDTEVRPLQPGPAGGEINVNAQGAERVRREDTSIVKDFVTNYLAAAAGEQKSAVDRVKEFLSSQAQATFRPPDGIKVIRVIGQPLANPDDPNVTIKYREIGVLKAKGILEPVNKPEEQTARFNIGAVNGQPGIFVRELAPALLLSDTALKRYYKRQTIYFWNQERSGLVPDVRYMPTSVPESARPTEVIDWLTSGPQPSIASLVEALPDDTKPNGNVPAVTNQTLQISLPGQVLPQDDQPGALQRLQQQLRWSLRPMPAATLALSIEHQTYTYTDSDYLNVNPAYQQTEPERFAVYNGQIMRLAQSYRSGEPVPIIRPQDNRGIVSAALAVSDSRSYAALVVSERDGKQSLKVGAAGTGDQVTLTRARLSGTPGRPVWAKSPNGTDPGTNGLITMGGKLFSFPAGGFSSRRPGLTAVQWPDGPLESITAVAVAPDAHRIALVAGGRLYVAGLSLGDGVLQVITPRAIRTELRNLTAVTWSSQEWLTLSGLKPDADRYAVMDIPIDGTEYSYRQDDLGSNPVTNLTSRPANAARSDENSGAVAYMLSGAAYDEQKPVRMTADDLAVKVANPPKDMLPIAPFFLN